MQYLQEKVVGRNFILRSNNLFIENLPGNILLLQFRMRINFSRFLKNFFIGQ